MSTARARSPADSAGAAREGLARRGGAMDAGAGPRFLFYSHDGIGLGHFRRNLLLAGAVTKQRPGTAVLLACGAEGMENFPLPDGVDVLRLPSVRKIGNGRYVARRLAVDAADIISLRSALLASAVESFRPDLLLVDKHPLGIHGELRPALQVLRSQGARAVLGLRDVLDDADGTLAEWQRSDLIRETAAWHDRVLVYGSAGFLSPVEAGALPPTVAAMATHCGYVVARRDWQARPPEMPPLADRPLVLASVGGGEDGLPVLEAFLAASHGATWRGLLVAGPQLPSADWRRLRRRAAGAGVFARRSIPQLARWYAHADAVVCMGGYNTLLEAVTAGAPTVCVPRTQPRREQLIRAQAFAERGLIELIKPHELTAARLRAGIERALDASRPSLAARARHLLDLRGAQRAAGVLLELAGPPAHAGWQFRLDGT